MSKRQLAPLFGLFAVIAFIAGSFNIIPNNISVFLGVVLSLVAGYLYATLGSK